MLDAMEHRGRRQTAGAQIGETPAQTFDRFPFFVAIARHHPAHLHGADIAAEVLFGLLAGGFGAEDEDKFPLAAILAVEIQHGLGRGAGTGEEIENNVVGFGGDA